jgi:hypothetical protein
MPGSRNDTTSKVTWSQITTLAKGNPVIAIWAIVLWISVTHPRLIFAFLILIFFRFSNPELFHSAIVSHVVYSIASTFKKLWN